jgi:hypothetical protein
MPPGQGKDLVTKGGLDVAGGLLTNTAPNSPVRLTVRVYVVRAYGLQPKDVTGKSDPYIAVKLGSRTIVDKENYVTQELNPTFGR